MDLSGSVFFEIRFGCLAVCKEWTYCMGVSVGEEQMGSCGWLALLVMQGTGVMELSRISSPRYSGLVVSCLRLE